MTGNRTGGGLLRILATTDLHGTVLPWDYAADAPAPGCGLAVMAALARERAAEADAVLRVDCGDALQGGAYDGPHGAAVIGAMNAARIDAMALGNHDLDFGAAAFARAARHARFPILSANVAAPPARPRCIVERDLGGAPLRIGIVGLTAPRLADPALGGGPGGPASVAAVAGAVRAARAAGARIVLVLSHAGPGTVPPPPGAVDVSAALAALPGVDAVVGGHVHAASASGAYGAPLVVPGAHGTALGEIDLRIARGRVAASSARLHVPDPDLAPDPAVLAEMRRAHAAARRRLGRIVGHAAAGLDARLSAARPTTALAAIAAARADALERALTGTDRSGLPVIGLGTARPPSAAVPNVPPGPVRRRDLEALCPYHDAQRGVLITGADLREWLERGASAYARVPPGARDAPLHDPDVPAWFLDLPHGGVSWTVDLSVPALFDGAGTRLGGPGRIGDLRLHGRPVDPAMRLVAATSDFRLLGHGPYAGFFDRLPTVHADPRPMRRLVADWLGTGRTATPAAFAFAQIEGSSVRMPAPGGPVAGFDPAGPGRVRMALDLRPALPSPISAARG